MYGQKNSTEVSKILVVYDYHPEETFQREIALELKKQNLPNVRFARYQGKHIPRNKDITGYHFDKFAKRHLPFDYALDLHASPDAVDIPERNITMPCFWYVYDSKIPISKNLHSNFLKYEKQLKQKYGRWANAFPKLLPTRYSGSKYAEINIEFFPRYLSKRDSLECLNGLIEILYKHPIGKA